MPDSAKRSVDKIIGRGLIAAESVAQDLRRRLVNQLSRNKNRLPFVELVNLARQTLSEFEPVLAHVMWDTEIAAWVNGLDVITKRTPKAVLNQLAARLPDPVPAGQRQLLEAFITNVEAGMIQPAVEFPGIEKATSSLLDRNIVTRTQFDAMETSAQRRAFTVAGQQSDETIGRIRDILAELIDEGTTSSEFRERVKFEIDSTPIGPGHLDTIYRTNTQAAFAAGQEELASDPIVKQVFPYARYNAIDDGRVRDEHLALESLGLNGTSIYRADDPMWRFFSPPWNFNCRCSKTYLTVRQAANAGVVEARRWDRTGQPPTNPSFRLEHIPFRPDNGFVGPMRLSSSVRLAFDESKAIRDDEGKFAEKPGSGASKDESRAPKEARAKASFTATPQEAQRIRSLSSGTGKHSIHIRRAIGFLNNGRPIFAKRAITRALKAGANNDDVAFLRGIASRIPRRKKESVTKKPSAKKNIPVPIGNSKAAKLLTKAQDALDGNKPILFKRFLTLARKAGATDEQIAFLEHGLTGKNRELDRPKSPPASKKAVSKKGRAPSRVGRTKQLVARMRKSEDVQEITNLLRQVKGLQNTRVKLTTSEGKPIDITYAKSIGTMIAKVYESMPEYTNLREIAVVNPRTDSDLKSMGGAYAAVMTLRDGTRRLIFDETLFKHRFAGLRSMLAREKKVRHAVSGTVEGLVAHEMGHVMHPGRFYEQRGRPFKLGIPGSGGLSDSSAVSDYIQRLPPKASDLSKYGTKNHRESFAEGFSSVMVVSPKKWTPWVHGFAKALKQSYIDSGLTPPAKLQKSLQQAETLGLEASVTVDRTSF